ncbi:MAG: polysaccharide biosynthesis protein [Planctomycetes bacterium]|nr:polysaccharide biosynthesis protein [Planctomycetota bacterium]
MNDYTELLERDTFTAKPDARAWSDKAVLVTGGCGTIGTAIVNKIRDVAKCVVVGDRNERALFDVEKHEKVVPILMDVTEPEHVNRAFDMFGYGEAHIVFHCAAYKHVPMMEEYPEVALTNNFLGTKHVVDATVYRSSAAFVFISTDKAASCACVMGRTKRLAEDYIQAKARQWVGGSLSIVRFGNVLGSSGSVIETWERQLEAGEPLTVAKDCSRYFCTVDEAASLAIGAAFGGRGCRIMTLQMGGPIEMEEMARRFLKMRGAEDHAVEIIGARNGDSPTERLAGEGEKLVEADGALEVVNDG